MSSTKRKLNESVECQIRSAIPSIAQIINEANRKQRRAQSKKEKNNQTPPAQPQQSSPTPSAPPAQPQQSQPVEKKKQGGFLSTIGSLAKQAAFELGSHLVDRYRVNAQTSYEQSQRTSRDVLLHHYSRALGYTPSYIHMVLTEYQRDEPLPPHRSQPDYANLVKLHQVNLKEYQERQKLLSAIEGVHRANPTLGNFKESSRLFDTQTRSMADDPKLQQISQGLRQRAQQEIEEREKRKRERQTP